MSRLIGGSELATRLVLGPLMLALVAGIFWCDATEQLGDFKLTVIVLGLLAVIAVWEYTAMLRGAGHAVSAALLLSFTGALCASAPFFQWTRVDHELYPLVMGTLLLLFPTAVRSLAQDKMRQGLEAQGATLLGFVLIAWPMFFAQGMAIRHLESILFVVLVCKSGDAGGYFFGRALGRRKLIPHISKGKTIEGTLGSAVTSAAVAVALGGPLGPPGSELAWTAFAAIGILLNVTAQIGDLIESLLKRRCNVKDSSQLLPAHGGVLDLVDSLLFSFPAYFIILVRLT